MLHRRSQYSRKSEGTRSQLQKLTARKFHGPLVVAIFSRLVAGEAGFVQCFEPPARVGTFLRFVNPKPDSGRSAISAKMATVAQPYGRAAILPVIGFHLKTLAKGEGNKRDNQHSG